MDKSIKAKNLLLEKNCLSCQYGQFEQCDRPIIKGAQSVAFPIEFLCANWRFATPNFLELIRNIKEDEDVQE